MTSTRCAAALAAAALLLLVACGDESPTTTKPPGPTSDEIKTELNALIDRSDTVIEEYDQHSSRFTPIGGPVFTASPNRSVREMLAATLGGFLFSPIEGSDPRLQTYDILGEEAVYEIAGEEEGISFAVAAWDRPDPRGRWHYAYQNLAGWMDHSFFFTTQTLSLDPVFDEISVYLDIFSIGTASHTNPTAAGGSATWRGVMVGFDESFAGRDISRLETSEPNVYAGNATLSIDDFLNPMIDVRFSNITNDVRYLDDVLWRDLPVADGGFEGAGILGRFYGPAHQEVGGVFQFSTINGAFGAVRQ